MRKIFTSLSFILSISLSASTIAAETTTSDTSATDSVTANSVNDSAAKSKTTSPALSEKPASEENKQTVDTSPAYPELKATYRAEWKGGWFPIGIEADRILRHNNDGTSDFIFAADATIGALEEKSVIRWYNGRVMPQTYSYKVTGLFNEPDRSQIFDWQKKQVINQENKRPFQGHWHDQLQDNLSYHLQASVDLKNGLTEFEYPVFDRKRIKNFRFKVVGTETLKTRMGRIEAIKIEQLEKHKSKKKTYIWFAPKFDYLLLRLWQRDKKGKVYQIDLIKGEIGGKAIK